MKHLKIYTKAISVRMKGKLSKVQGHRKKSSRKKLLRINQRKVKRKIIYE